MASHNGTALITGASSGIGAIYADRLAKRGYDLVLVARSADRLRRLAAEISDRTGRAVEVLQADLGSPIDLKRVETLLRTDQSVTMLVNNAGVGAIAPLLDSDVDSMEALIALNVTAPMRLAYAAAPGFVARGSGTLINIASAVAVGPERLNGVYGGSKAFVLAFSQSLHHELADKGIRIQAVLPGATATRFWNSAGSAVESLPSEIVMSAQAAVDSALAGLDLGELVTIPSLPDVRDWDRFEQARLALQPNLSRAVPAARESPAHERAA